MDPHQAYTYRKDLYYIQLSHGDGSYSEKVVSRFQFYLTWFGWFVIGKRFKKYRNLNVLCAGRKR